MSWKDELLDASIRGVPFKYEDTKRKGGRRGPDHEFPWRNDCYPEDMGRKKAAHTITGYVIGDDYMVQREALEAALDDDGEATLLHPYRGPLTVIIRDWSTQEVRDEGRMARVEFECIESGGEASPVSALDTQNDTLDGADALDDELGGSFEDNWGQTGGDLLGMLEILTDALQAQIDWPGLDTSQIAPQVADLASLVDDPIALAAAVIGFNQGYAKAVQAYIEANPFDERYSSRGPLPVGDPTYGLMAMAQFKRQLTQVGPNAVALAELVEGSSVTALSRIYAITDFQAQDDADAARSLMLQLIDGRAAQVANGLGDRTLWDGYQALLTVVSRDLTSRGKQVPATVDLTCGPLPALALAQRFYADATRAGELISRNAAPHPLFVGPDIQVLTR